jgi:hypothetical protein
MSVIMTRAAKVEQESVIAKGLSLDWTSSFDTPVAEFDSVHPPLRSFDKISRDQIQK